ncbi:P-loop containing nucleoside triphosphate hydrolase protein [Calocera viscosa TUFC12733]|uniref:p-loop containing nucleoside triphosphate hydrolase protein n=1 Tax=Calocera viscosa (strain TUFC12733) TaxID=1330018 RepID=A0A167L0C7_CALVF|nr:P-loop containing nucleoside triphosphate hydrolase protein [Calocera viscosa TUFC12733]
MSWTIRSRLRLPRQTWRLERRTSFLALATRRQLSQLSSAATSVLDDSPAPTGSITLRPYQESCIQSCLDALSAGYTRIGVSSPTGSGKTAIFLSLISRMPPPESRPDATQALVIVSSVELVRQTAKTAAAMFPRLRVEVEQSRTAATGTADLTIGTYQTLISQGRLQKFDPSRMKAVVVDEAHHAAAPSYRQILSYFDPVIGTGLAPDAKPPAEVEAIEDNVKLQPAPEEAASSGVPIIGFSATFSRHDGLALGKVFQQIVYHRDFLEMIKEQWLCNVRFTIVKATLNLSKVRVSSATGDFTPSSLAHVVNAPSINKLVVKTWLDRAKKRKSTLIFCADVQHVIDLTDAFRKRRVDAHFLHSKMAASEREDLLSDFRQGKFPVLVNCAILVEGADMPNIDCVVLCRPTRSRNLFAQMIGRGMRLSPDTGKTDCRIIDFVDSISRVQGVVNVPTLFGLDPDTIVKDDASLEEMQEEMALEKEVTEEGFGGPEPSFVTYIDYDDPFELSEDASGSPSVIQLSRLAWVRCGQNYILECVGKGFITLKLTSDKNSTSEEFEGFFTAERPRRHSDPRRDPSTDYLRRFSIFKADSLHAAIRAGDTYAQTKVNPGRMALPLFRSARWRREPASPLQAKFLKKRLQNTIKKLQDMDPVGVFSARAQSHEDKWANLTKGQAANMITRMRHGSQAHYDTKISGLMQQSRKATKEREKEARRQARHAVAVGPLPGSDPLPARSQSSLSGYHFLDDDDYDDLEDISWPR